MKKDNIINSFKINDTLSPDVWDGVVMKKEIRDKLLEIVDEFIGDLDVKFFVEDITLTGSLSNYNWSEYSDFDLHIIIDYEQFDDPEITKKYFDAKKTIFNDNYKFTIKDKEVEIYAQDITEEHYSSGVFSLMKNEWIVEPKYSKIKINHRILKSKIKIWQDVINKVVSSQNDKTLKTYENEIKKIKDKLKKYRKIGLDSKGENSYENMVFKFLRRNGDIAKLINTMRNKKNKELSIEAYLNEQIDLFFNKEKNPFIEMVTKGLKELVSGRSALNFKGFNQSIELLQKVLLSLGYKLPKYGVDGRLGEETTTAMNQFKKDNGLNDNDLISDNIINKLVEKLKEKNISEADFTKRNYQLPQSSKKLSFLDLNADEGYKKYAEICNKFISKRNSVSQITGEMMAASAKRYFASGYVPPEIACAQLIQEGGLSNNPNARPIRTNNPFNVGNVDSGKNKFFPSISAGIDAYYRLMVKNYLPKGKDAHHLLRRFVNISGNRYASDPNYERKINSIISSVV